MADLYASTFVGVKDGTKSPPDRADGRLVFAKRSTVVAPKVAAQAVAIGDQMYIGTVRQNESVREIRVNTDTSLGATTISIGTKANTTKYVNGATITAPLNVPVILGPRTAPASAAPLTADEDLWATFGVAAIAGAVVMLFETDITSVK